MKAFARGVSLHDVSPDSTRNRPFACKLCSYAYMNGNTSEYDKKTGRNIRSDNKNKNNKNKNNNNNNSCSAL